MGRRILHILSQRPGRTGSGVTLEAMVRHAAHHGWRQAVVVGLPADEAISPVGGLDRTHILPVRFGSATGHPATLPFPIPGMSDVMPYRSSIWSDLSSAQLAQYRKVWRAHLGQVIAAFQPDVIHCHHIWLVSSLLKEIAPNIPAVATCHSTGLRQMDRLPELGREVARGCAHLDHFCVLRDDHASQLATRLQVPTERITTVGAGYDTQIFHTKDTANAPAPRTPQSLLYTGKYSHAKGLPWLLDAMALLPDQHPQQLHIAGSGSGSEADAMRARLESMAPRVVLHGHLQQSQLAALMRRCHTLVLPSFYEGVPLVLAEAAASGCRLVCTALPGVIAQIQPHLGPWLELVPLPRLTHSDRPLPADLPKFVTDLAAAIDRSLAANASQSAPDKATLSPFSWELVCRRIESIWQSLTGPTRDY